MESSAIVERVKVEKIDYFNQPNCYKLSNDTVEIIVTTDIGPRIIRYGFNGADNMLGEWPESAVHTELGDWKPWGGHRLWAAPEANPRSYAPANGPVEHEIQGNSIRLIKPVEPGAGLQKEMRITLDNAGTGVTVHHKLTNRNLWAIETAPWAITIMNGGGEAVLPQEPYRSWSEALLPARPLVLWHYTDLSDPRWTINGKFISLKTDDRSDSPQKIGVANKQGWAAYIRRQTLFVKRFAYQEGAAYPDYGCNNEIYVAGSYIELESLGHLQRLEPGASAEHVERWYLFRDVSVTEGTKTLDEILAPLIAQTPAQ